VSIDLLRTLKATGGQWARASPAAKVSNLAAIEALELLIEVSFMQRYFGK